MFLLDFCRGVLTKSGAEKRVSQSGGGSWFKMIQRGGSIVSPSLLGSEVRYILGLLGLF